MKRFAWILLWTASATAAPAEPPQFALAVNSPFSWMLSRETDGPKLAFAASAYVGIGRHQAVRVNVASYEVDPWALLLADGFVAAAGGDPGECSRGGHARDVGVGWMYFLRERWRGPSFELGVLGRERQTSQCLSPFPDGFTTNEVTTSTTTIAARGLVGWSWLVADQLYLSLAAGGSVGVEWGTETPDVTSRVLRSDLEPEIFARLGWVFDL